MKIFTNLKTLQRKRYSFHFLFDKHLGVKNVLHVQSHCCREQSTEIEKKNKPRVKRHSAEHLKKIKRRTVAFSSSCFTSKWWIKPPKYNLMELISWLPDGVLIVVCLKFLVEVSSLPFLCCEHWYRVLINLANYFIKYKLLRFFTSCLNCWALPLCLVLWQLHFIQGWMPGHAVGVSVFIYVHALYRKCNLLDKLVGF